MDTYITLIVIIDPITHNEERWFGPEIKAISWEDAENQSLLYKIPDNSEIIIKGKLVGEVPMNTNIKTIEKLQFININEN